MIRGWRVVEGGGDKRGGVMRRASSVEVVVEVEVKGWMPQR